MSNFDIKSENDTANDNGIKIHPRYLHILIWWLKIAYKIYIDADTLMRLKVNDNVDI